MKISLKTQSPVLFGSGEGGALVNVDLTVHPTGFPFVPGRTFKGLLKESFLEVQEMMQQENARQVRDLFGHPGTVDPVGKLRFPNLYLPQWDELLRELAPLQKAFPAFFHPHNIRAHYTREIPQTAMKDGVAKQGSLRMYRVLKPEIELEGYFQISEPLTEEEKELLTYAAHNLRFAGTRRNKGFGEIKVQIDWEENAPLVTPSGKAVTITPRRWEVKIETLSPVLIPDQRSDQNTVNTFKHIPGSVLRGIVATRLIKAQNLGKEADDNPVFYDAILSGAVNFGPLFPQGAPPVALNITRPKGSDGKKLFDSLKPNPTGVKLRPINGFGTNQLSQPEEGKEAQPELTLQKVKTEFSFHNSRPDRTAGRQTGEGDDSQGIFYYEAISSGQEFTGHLTGDTEAMKKLVAATGLEFECRIGKSRSAQYGRAKVKISPSEPPRLDLDGDNQIDLVCLSPVLLSNEYGLCTPSVKLLVEELQAAGLKVESIEKREAKFQAVTTYNSVWKSKAEQEYAFVTGSVFRFQIGQNAFETFEKVEQKGLGIRRNEGFGKIKFIPTTHFPVQLPEKKTSESKSDSSPASPSSDHPTLKKFIDEKLQNEEFTKAKQQGISDAIEFSSRNNYGMGISNSLRSRLLQFLDELSGLESASLAKTYWDERMAHIEKRIAGRALKDAGIWDGLRKRNDWDNKTIQHPILYWTAFFETLRFKNKTYEKA